MGRKARNIKFSEFYMLGLSDVSSVRLEIPEFQRNYVWGKDKIKELLDSINENDEGYYIGNIVTISDNGGSTSKDKIVDGQQRLVTISLLLSAIYHSIPTLKAEIEDKIFEIFPDNPRIYFSREKLNNIYVGILKTNSIPNSLDHSEKNIADAYEYIKNTWLENIISNIDEFLNKIKNIEFVVIKCETEDDAFQLFEGLNSTGVSLGPVELIKNAIFSKVKELDPSKLEEFTGKWENIEKKFEKSNFIWFQKFIRQHFFWDFGPVGIPKLFKAIKAEKIKNKNISDVTKYIENLNEDSDVYLDLRKGNYNFISLSGPMPGVDRKECMEIIYNVSFLGLDQVYSILLSMIKYGNINNEYFRGNFLFDLKKIWSLLLILKFTKVSPASYEGIFARACKAINGKKYSEFRKYIDEDFFPELVSKIDGTRDSFIKNFKENFYGDDYNEGFCRKLLIDVYSLNEKTGIIINSLEHIIPKNYTSWSILESEDKRIMNKKIWTIGNLTILEENLNSNIENFIFDKKVSEGFSKSALGIINKEVIKYNFGIFPLVAVDERGQYLAGKIYDHYFGILLT